MALPFKPPVASTRGLKSKGSHRSGLPLGLVCGLVSVMVLVLCLSLTASLRPHAALSSLAHLAFCCYLLSPTPSARDVCMVFFFFFEKCLSVFLTLTALLTSTLYPSKLWSILPMDDLNQALLLGHTWNMGCI